MRPTAGPAGDPTVVDRRWGTVWVWLLAASPWLSFVTGLIALRSFITYQAPEWHWIALVLVPYALVVGLAVLDVRQLRQWHNEVAHWSWSFLGAPVYLIARTIAFRKLGRFGSAPLWVALASIIGAGLVLLAMVGVVIWIVSELSRSMS
jgi:hypothetical protein